jgi:hypothetical protein
MASKTGKGLPVDAGAVVVVVDAGGAAGAVAGPARATRLNVRAQDSNSIVRSLVPIAQ